MKTRAQRGFSLIEMMVVVGISTTLMVGTSATLLSMTKSTMQAEAKGTGQAMVKNIEQSLTDPTSCMTTLAGKGFSPDSAGTMPLALSLQNQSIGSGYTSTDDGITVRDLSLRNVRPLNMNGVNNRPVYTGDVMADIQRSDPKAPAMRAQRVTRLYFEVDPGSHSIISCTTKSQMPDLLGASCTQMGGVYANGACDMSAYANAIVAEANRQVDTEFYGPFSAQMNQQLDSDLAQAMNQLKASGANATTNYTNAVMGAVNSRLAGNVGQVSNDINNLNNRITASLNDLTGQNASSQAYATAILQQATNSYNNAMGAYAGAQAAQVLAANTQNNVNYASGVAGNALSFGLYSVDNSRNISSIAYGAMNNAMGAVAGSNEALNLANAANGTAVNTANFANATNGSATESINYSSTAVNHANDAANYATQANNSVADIRNQAIAAANQASYAAGAASVAYSNANYAYNHPPQINQIDTNTVTFVPKGCAARGSYVDAMVNVYFNIHSDTVTAYYLHETRPAQPGEVTGTQNNPYTQGLSCIAGDQDTITSQTSEALFQVIPHWNGKGEAYLYSIYRTHQCQVCAGAGGTFGAPPPPPPAPSPSPTPSPTPTPDPDPVPYDPWANMPGGPG